MTSSNTAIGAVALMFFAPVVLILPIVAVTNDNLQSKERNEIIGEWKLEYVRDEKGLDANCPWFEWHISKVRIVMKSNSGQLECSYKLNRNHNPKLIEFTVLSGSYKGITRKGVFVVDDGRLIVQVDYRLKTRAKTFEK